MTRIPTRSATTLRTRDDDRALQRAENEGLPVPVPGAVRRDAGTVYHRMTAYLTRTCAGFTRRKTLTRTELLAALADATDRNRRLRTQAAPLMALIASDIRMAATLRGGDVEAAVTRSLRVWRQRYNGLDACLPGRR